MPRKRALSDTGLALFAQAYFLENDANKPPSVGCLRSLVHKLFTSDYDIKLEDTSKNMRSSTSKVLSLLYSIKKIPEIHDNAISNLVALILSNGEKTLTKHQVKYNIGFYLNLAKKAMESNDHQTALIIKAALNNFHITRLKIKPNKSMKKTLILLEEKYGDFKSMHSKHVCDMIKNKHDTDYLPSTMVLHMHLSKNRAYESAYRSFGKKNSNLDVVNYQLHELQSIKYHEHKKTNYELCPIYENNPLDLDVINQFPKKPKSMNEFLFTLSCNVK